MRYYQISDDTKQKDELNAHELDELNWFVVQTPPMREFDAKEVLTKYGFKIICPLRKSFARINRHSKRKRHLEFPLLKGYILAGFNGTPNWHKFFTKGRQHGVVSSVIRFEGKPAAIPRTKQQWVSKMHQTTLTKTSQEDEPGFKVGDSVEIIEGPFTGLPVSIEHIKNGKARVRITFLGREQIAHVPIDILQEVAYL